LVARCCLAALVGAAALALLARSGCLASPYAALDPRLASLWLDNVAETLSLRRLMELRPGIILGCYGVPLLALVVGLRGLVASPERERSLLPLCAALAAALATAVWEYRAVATALCLAAPFLALEIARLCARARVESSARPILIALLLSPPVLAAFS